MANLWLSARQNRTAVGSRAHNNAANNQRAQAKEQAAPRKQLIAIASPAKLTLAAQLAKLI